MNSLSKTTKNVCVIGAGASGLIATKELLDEGHQVSCFEKYSKLGGVFNYSDFKGGVYDSTQLTVSNYFMAYSCFPPKSDEKRKYWTRREYSDYLNDFVANFKLAQHIQYNRKITSVKRQDNGQYSVIVAQSEDPSQTEIYVFDAVAVCSGTHQIPREIEIKGKENFKGKIRHSASYKRADVFKGKRVLCVGIGETGADITHEIAQVAKKCVLSIRQYQSILERYPYGREHTNDAYTSYALYSMPTTIQNLIANTHLAMMEKFSKNAELRAYAKWNRKAGNYFNHFFTKNEIFFKSIAEGKLEVNTAGIDHLEGNEVIFKDGSRVEVDSIILNTGYVDQFPFIKDAEIIDVRKMYKHMIHPDLGIDIVLIGWARPAVGGVPACSEMQSRYFALLCSNQLQLPDNQKLQTLIQKQANYEQKIYHKNPLLKTLVHYSSYMHDFAKIIGCSPWQMATFVNLKLLNKVWYGSQLPNIYRLYGPHNNPKQAKETIYKMSIAIKPIDQVMLFLFMVITKLLAKLKIISADPSY